jgi:hypothetical protein
LQRPEWGEFPASWENTGNSSHSGLGDAKLLAKKLKRSMTYKQNPYATEQGINSTVSGI